jgi:hypothetical protein
VDEPNFAKGNINDILAKYSFKIAKLIEKDIEIKKKNQGPQSRRNLFFDRIGDEVEKALKLGKYGRMGDGR